MSVCLPFSLLFWPNGSPIKLLSGIVSKSHMYYLQVEIWLERRVYGDSDALSKMPGFVLAKFWTSLSGAGALQRQQQQQQQQ